MKSTHKYRLWLSVIIILMATLSATPQGNICLASSVNSISHVQDNELVFSFYGKSLQAAKIKTNKVKSTNEFDVAQAWQNYKRVEVEKVCSSLRSLATELGLNDWFILELVRSYVDELLISGSPMDRVVLEHYLLVAMGYDVRIARTEHQLLLLVPIKQQIYEHGFVRADGKEYYLFFDDLEDHADDVTFIQPCDPSKNDVGKGQSFSLLFDNTTLNVRYGEDYTCVLDDGNISVTYSVNEGLMEMLRNYPLMDPQSYVTSVVIPQFQHSILEQLKPQIEDLSQCEAANALLHFVQNAFEYENDRDSYGHEKLNFIEENFFYSKNDCDDRSILFAFLVHSLLGLDVQIVEYPGHECTGVRFTDCLSYGNGYYYGDDYYLICDPSYVGAGIGKCMPKYRSVSPRVYVMNTSTVNQNNNSPLKPVLEKAISIPEITIQTIDLSPESQSGI